MTFKGIGLLIVVLAATTVLHSVHAEEDEYCKDAIMSLSPCLDYITTSNMSSVDETSPCCDTIMTVIHKHPSCLSSIVEDRGTRILALPAECMLLNHRFSQISPLALMNLVDYAINAMNLSSTFEAVVCDGILEQEDSWLCRDYVVKEEKNPSPECCRHLESLIMKYPFCPLSFLSMPPSPSSFGTAVVVDRRHALSLPGACLLQFLSTNPDYLKVPEFRFDSYK